MAEVYTFGDMFDDLRHRGFFDASVRRLRVQGALWMAMAMCTQSAVTVTYRHELWRTAMRIAPPDTRLGLPTIAMFQALIPGGLLEGWERRETDEAVELGNRARDRYMVEACRDCGIAFVSRDAAAVKYALSLGVRAVSPEDYARDVLPRKDARMMFLRRLDTAVLLMAHRHVGYRLLRGLTQSEEVDRDDWLLAHLRDVVQRYEGTWEWRWRDPGESRW